MLSGVVLAGGAGSRIGGDKGLMEVSSRPMVLHVVDSVARVADDVVVSVRKGNVPRYEGILGERARIVEDREAGMGPLEGLCTAFAEARNEYVAVAPCDAILLKSEVLGLLADRAEGADGAVPIVRGFVEPLIAVYGRVIGLQSFERGLSEGNRKVGDAITGLRLRKVGEPELRMVDPDLLSFWNVNSQEDLRRAATLTTRTGSMV